MPVTEEAAAHRYIADPRVHVGHVHLKVADLQRALEFYSGVLGLQVTQRYGQGAVFLSAGGYHHHIALNTWESLRGSPPPPGSTGLYHSAIVYPSRAALATALRRVLAAGIRLQGAADHGVSESIYLNDPDNNGVELYCDKPKEKWPRGNNWRTGNVYPAAGSARAIERTAGGNPDLVGTKRSIAVDL